MAAERKFGTKKNSTARTTVPAVSALAHAKDLWQRTLTAQFQSIDAEAQLLKTATYETDLLPAKGWCALAVGRHATVTGDARTAERYLLEAYGYFHLAGDLTGAALVDSHLALLLTQRKETLRANQLLAAAHANEHLLDPLSRAIIHSVAGACCGGLPDW